ncbi:F1-ATPase delta subunit [Schizosaccharomyces japonicus yFS275]|uniref:ATP synthase subunit delta, mitochondrial n=1 Tax=Schizosaccharomyces japonicus (strain yFS275 / FY16936) TaxID=402676 RepID=B6K3D0_SCHJY|nr:F1-ATPase delta subunit [Schizosaccharomyces japonicus yFS275]EEB07987.1 F1-ATPase delta subunit [Schizosaccharomyces japonicus yFS275]
MLSLRAVLNPGFSWRPVLNKLPRTLYVTRKYAKNAAKATSEAPAADGLLLSFALPSSTLYERTPVTQVDIPTEHGDMGILKNHVPIIECLRPGVIKITDVNGATDKLFSAGGFAVQQPNNHLCITSPEAFRLDDFASVSEVTSLLDQAKTQQATASETEKPAVDVRISVLEAILQALRG